MKKKIPPPAISRVIWLLAIPTLSNACKKEKDAPTPDQPNEQLIRAWKMDRVTLNDQPYPGHEFDNWQLDFRKDGTCILSDGTQSSPGKWGLGPETPWSWTGVRPMKPPLRC